MPIKRYFSSAFLVAVCALSGGVSAQPVSTSKPQTADIQGEWRSVAPESYGNHYAIRSFSIFERNWQVRYQAFADERGQQPLFTIRVNGVYSLGDLSAKVADAREGIFPALSRSLTADSEAGVQMFASMGCRLQQGQETLLLNTSCGFVPGLMQAMGEYDLLALRNGQLYFGDRTGDLSKVRPQSLTPYPLQKRP